MWVIRMRLPPDVFPNSILEDPENLFILSHFAVEGNPIKVGILTESHPVFIL